MTHKPNQSHPSGESHVDGTQTRKYEELKSSAYAFIIVGMILLAFSILCWAQIIRLPMEGVMKVILQTLLSVMGIASIAYSAASTHTANHMAELVKEEEQTTEELTGWFLSAYTAEALDRVLEDELEDVGPEEVSLKRLNLIQDLLITQKDLPDQAYVDALAEDLYERLYES